MLILEAPTATKSAYPVIYRNLMTVGLLGTMYRVGEDAQTIHATVEMTLEDAHGYSLYRTVAMAMAGHLDEAREALASRIEEEPQNGENKIAMAVAMLFGGDRGWRYWIDNVLATHTDQEAREAALGVLKYVSRQDRRVALH
ncbi:hypothetical protein [Acidovorax sp. SUPP3334]|uniref:hypothetical protein n=1 Tax=Acidovorax sp. SUPP3334 TaxID=2920881 RepID=UPI0023DE36BA|nr:hypothetical protein [Acidovorax sp. SUPP3334]GKT20972.1 hypothetical protein AVHM3334_03060 [Acidovorax sp. SUPP3334]